MATTGIKSVKTIYEQEHFINLLNGFMFGALLALMIYNLYVYIAIKDRSYLHYTGYIGSGLAFLITWIGYFNDWFSVSNLSLLTVTFCATLIFGVLFTNGYLHTAQYAPRLFKIHRWLIIGLLIPFGIDLIGFGELAFELLPIMSFITIWYWLIAAYISFRNKFKPSHYYIIALTFLLIGYLLYEKLQLVMFLQAGLCLEALTLSFALAVNLNNLKKETTLLKKNVVTQTEGFAQELIIGQESEKENIANELNKSIGQQLVHLKNEVFILKKVCQNHQQELMIEIATDIGKAIEEVSSVSFSLRPYQMNILGLKSSVQNLVEDIRDHTETNIYLEIDDIDQLLKKNMEMHIYRVIQELLNNLIKHAEASDCWINIKHIQDELRFSYRDNGIGFNKDGLTTGLGLLGIRERCDVIHAKITVRSQQSLGTEVNIKIPLCFNNNLILKKTISK
ncbi:7TM diverse intracellular signaling domain-containing protein [Pedobacter sp. ASV1-7]|uniref:sensor histidine kinase n=1 Tax=Pedobacter sp. ASV1-7 TaxID=3145237 RepID=UPI0032E8F8FC